MRCNVCGIEGAAIYRRTADGREIALTVCPACYRKLYPEDGGGDLFASFVGRTEQQDAADGTHIVCEGCGTTLEDFRRTGLVGCAACYTAFRRQLIPTIRYIQGRLKHAGKAPSGAADANYDTVRELVEEQESLRSSLKEAEREGDAERASRLRACLDAVNRRLYGGEET